MVLVGSWPTGTGAIRTVALRTRRTVALRRGRFHGEHPIAVTRVHRKVPEPMRTLRLAAALISVLAVVACASPKPGWTYAPAPSATPIPSVQASGSAAPPPSASAAPSGSAAASAPASASTGGGTVLEIEAEGIAYKESQLTAPAKQAFKIDFKNNDAGTPHNVSIHKDSPTGAEVFKGEIFPGVDERTYDVPALDAGTYAFVCTVHPNMTGTLTVQ
jgi:plastocyanin